MGKCCLRKEVYRGDQASHEDVSYKAIPCVGLEELHFFSKNMCFGVRPKVDIRYNFHLWRPFVTCRQITGGT
jgi:hypothetical protein